jgi:hypothetical protein
MSLLGPKPTRRRPPVCPLSEVGRSSFPRLPDRNLTDLPDKRIFGKRCPALSQKIFRFTNHENQKYGPPRPALTGGADRDRHGRGARDAMDVDARETNARSRTAKSCGPGLPTLRSSAQVMILRVMGAKKPGSQGDHV